MDEPPIAWRRARTACHEAGREAIGEPIDVELSMAGGLTLAAALRTRTRLPAFPTSSVDGYATRGPGPWRIVARVLAGQMPSALNEGEAVEIATGAMVPAGAEQIIRTEDSTLDASGIVTGTARPAREWREPGEEAGADELLLPAGTVVTPAVVGLAAACGHDTLTVFPAPKVALLIFGDELLTSGEPGNGRVRDSLGPQLPGWLRRLGAHPVSVTSPVPDTLDAHIKAIDDALTGADLVVTTGGTMRGPVDHLHPALASLRAEYVVNTVAVRPGYPMLLARVTTDAAAQPRFVAGLPGNPQSAIVALMSLVEPLLRGLTGAPAPELARVRLAEAVPGRGDYTHLALARLDQDTAALPVGHAGSSMLRGLAQADGFVVVEPGTSGSAGSLVPFLALPRGRQ